MSSLLVATTIPNIAKTYPEPSELDDNEPHIKNVYSKPVKYRGKYHLKYDCYETEQQQYYGTFASFMGDDEIHSFYRTHHSHWPSFSIYWKRVSKIKINCQFNDIIFDNEDDTIYILSGIDNNLYVHPIQQHNVRVLTGKKIDMIAFEKRGTIKCETSKVYDILANTIEKIGSKDSSGIIFKVFAKINYGKCKANIMVPLKKKLYTITNPEKRPDKCNKFFSSMSYNFPGWIQPMLEQENVPYNIVRKMVTSKMRQREFDRIFKWKNSKISERIGAVERGYIDFITLKINLARNVFRIKAIFLKENLESGEILGEDLIPDNWSTSLN